MVKGSVRSFTEAEVYSHPNEFNTVTQEYQALNDYVKERMPELRSDYREEDFYNIDLWRYTKDSELINVSTRNYNLRGIYKKGNTKGTEFGTFILNDRNIKSFLNNEIYRSVVSNHEIKASYIILKFKKPLEEENFKEWAQYLYLSRRLVYWDKYEGWLLESTEYRRPKKTDEELISEYLKCNTPSILSEMGNYKIESDYDSSENWRKVESYYNGEEALRLKNKEIRAEQKCIKAGLKFDLERIKKYNLRIDEKYNQRNIDSIMEEIHTEDLNNAFARKYISENKNSKQAPFIEKEFLPSLTQEEYESRKRLYNQLDPLEKKDLIISLRRDEKRAEEKAKELKKEEDQFLKHLKLSLEYVKVSGSNYIYYIDNFLCIYRYDFTKVNAWDIDQLIPYERFDALEHYTKHLNIDYIEGGSTIEFLISGSEISREHIKYAFTSEYFDTIWEDLDDSEKSFRELPNLHSRRGYDFYGKKFDRNIERLNNLFRGNIDYIVKSKYQAKVKWV